MSASGGGAPAGMGGRFDKASSAMRFISTGKQKGIEKINK